MRTSLIIGLAALLFAACGYDAQWIDLPLAGLFLLGGLAELAHAAYLASKPRPETGWFGR